MVSDAVVFFRLHNTWQIYICPSPGCLCFFAESDSLIMHLMREHLSVIHDCNAWPLPRHDTIEEQWCSEAIRSMVWKPLDASSAFTMLCAEFEKFTGADGHSSDADIGSLVLPLSEDTERSKLLNNLGKSFEILLASNEKVSFSVLSNGRLRGLATVASEHICGHLDPRNHMPLRFRTLLDSSLLPFRFMDPSSLCIFARLVDEMCKIVGQAAQNLSSAISCESRESELDAISDPIADGTVGYCFVLDAAKVKPSDIGEGGITSWLLNAPCIPSVQEVPTGSSEILQLVQRNALVFKERLTTVHMQPTDQPAELPFCFKLWGMGRWRRDTTCMPHLDTVIPDLASNSKSSNNILPSSDQSATEHNKRRRIAYSSEMMHCHLELIKLTCELQCLEPQVHKLCATDLRVYILPLLRSFLRMKLYQYGAIFSVAEEVGKADVDSDCVMEEQEEIPGMHVCSKVKGNTSVGESDSAATPHLGSGKENEESFFTPLEFRSNSSTERSEESPLHDPVSSNTGGSNSESGISKLDAMVIDGREPSVANDVNAPLFRINARNFGAVSESKAKPELDARSQSLAEPGYEVQPESPQEFVEDNDSLSDSETDAEEESEREALKMNDPILCDLNLFMGESRASDTEGIGLFVCVKITDVMKHCTYMRGAESIWAWRNNKTPKYWQCNFCTEKFTNKDSHMVHMECKHELGLSYGKKWLMPLRVWFGEEAEQDLEREGETLGNNIHSLDDSITADQTFRFVTIDAVKFCEIPFRSEVPKEPRLEETKASADIVLNLRDKLCQLRLLCDAKQRLLHYSKVDELDAEIVRRFRVTKKLKQDLSNYCVHDYKEEIMQGVRSFMCDKISINGELISWASIRLQDLLHSVRYEGIKIELESAGKVLVYIMEDATSGYGFGFGFAYIGMSWKFCGESTVCGSFQFAGLSDIGSVDPGHHSETKVTLYEGCKLTSKMKLFKSNFDWHMCDNVWDKLLEFQAEFRMKVGHRMGKMVMKVS